MSISIQDIKKRAERDGAGAVYFPRGVVVIPPQGKIWAGPKSHILEAKWGAWIGKQDALLNLATDMDKGLEPCNTPHCVFCTETEF